MKDDPTHHRRLLLHAARLAGALSGALGVLVLTGWYTHTPVLIQVLPGFVPMQYNTACGFLLSGLGLLFAISGWPRIALGCGLVVAALGVLTLLQYLFAIDLGIDQLLMQHYVTVEASHPGRMAPNTALCFALSGTAMILMPISGRWKPRLLILGLLGSLTVVLDLIAFFGYLTGLEAAYGWRHLPRMAVHTAVGFLLVGSGITACAWHQSDTTVEARRRGLLLSVGIGGILLTLLLWQALVVHEQIQIKEIIATEARNIGEKVEARLQARIDPLIRMGERWEARGGTPKLEWEADAALYAAHHSEYQAIEWVDATYHVRWIVPLAGNEAAVDLNLASETQRHQALLAAQAQRAPTLSRVVDLVQGGKGFLVHIPLYPGETFGGFLLGVFRVPEFLSSIVAKPLSRGYAVALFDGEEEVYRQAEHGTVYEAAWAHEVMLDAHQVAWRLRVWPGDKQRPQLQSMLPAVTLIIGLAMTGLLMLTVQAASLARRRAHEAEVSYVALEAVNVTLQDAISERETAEAELRRAHDELEQRVQARTAELAAANENLQRYATDLERSNKELDQFAYVASHDLKAPLRAIEHLAQWIAEDAGDVLPEASRQDLALLQQRVNRMAALLDSLLAYSRIGRSQSEAEVIDTEELIKDILSLLDIPETLTISTASGFPSFEAPKPPVELVLRNLIGNAIKHHDCADGHVEITGRDCGGAVELCVADDGPGIDPAYHAQIFEMFQTLKPRDQVEGSGMGLALVKKTVEHYGGTISIESEVKHGARFYVTWPKHSVGRT